MPINIDIPEAVIRNAVAVAIAESFAPEKRDALLRDIIRAHLQVRASEYDKDTLLGKKVGEIVRRVAMEEVGDVLDSMRPNIERIIQEALGPQFKESVYTSLRTGLQRLAISNISVSVNMDHYKADVD